MARDIDPPRRQHEPGNRSDSDQPVNVDRRIQRVLNIVLPVAIALSVLLAYQTRSGVDEAAETSTQVVSGASVTLPDQSTAAQPQEAGNDSYRPEGSVDEESESQRGEFSPASAALVPEETPTDTVATTVEINWSLGSGDSSISTPFLPLNGAVRNIELPNYDSDRDDDQGLTVQIGEGLDEQDPAKIQRWIADPGAVSKVDGSPTLELWLAAKDFDPDKSGRVVAGLYECSTAGEDCNLLANGDAGFDQATFGEDFGRVAVNMSQLSAAVAPDRALLVKLAVAESSETDLWVAYGTTTYRTFLTLR